jgi:hypothetical protein
MVTARCPGEKSIAAGEMVHLALDPDRIHRFGADGKALVQ